MIYFCALCLNFERRLSWQLSSIAEQVDSDGLQIEIAGLSGSCGALSEIASTFRTEHRLNIRVVEYERDVFAYRGYVRSAQILNARSAGSDWIFFADCDNVYHPEFFRGLKSRLLGDLRNAKGCIAARGKIHTAVSSTNAAIEDAAGSLYVRGAYQQAESLPRQNRHNRSIAGGGMQVCRIDDIMAKTGGVYVPDGESRDKHLFSGGQKARSDIQFRSVMGGSTMIDLPPEIHLQHSRDKEEGRHLEDQR